MKRSRSNDGTPNHAMRLLPIHPDVLRRLLIIFTGEKREARKPMTYHGPKAARGSPECTLSDEEVLAIRKMRFWYGMKVGAICEATGEVRSRVEMIVAMRNRVHLDPGPCPEN